MLRSRLTAILVALVLLASACQRTPSPGPVEPTPNPTPTMASGVVISEVMAGVQGNNNYEFIELYNISQRIIDLKGWSLWYRLATDSEDRLVYRWAGQALVPPQGHYLLSRTGVDLGVSGDSSFDQALNTFGGGLALRNSDQETVDALGWGKAPMELTEGEPAPAIENGYSLERAPGGQAGNNHDSGSNALDFFLVQTPTPQNTGSPSSPESEPGITLSLSAPSAVEPGSRMEYSLTITNQSGRSIHNVNVFFPIPKGLEPGGGNNTLNLENGIFTWRYDLLEAGQRESMNVSLQVPWKTFTALARDYYAQGDDQKFVAFGGPVATQVEGGLIPIQQARALPNAELSVDGIATMYTGGYYAGGGNTKFYIQDPTGGLQVQVFGGQGVVNVNIGARVQVTGKMGIYRGAMQIVPNMLPENVQVLAPPSQTEPVKPTPVTIGEAISDRETLPGQLVQVEGTVARLEEFTYSFEMDLVDDQNHSLTLYIDKLTGIEVESIQEGARFQAAGILEVRDDRNYLYPRLQSDLVEVYPPELMITGHAPATIAPGEVFTTTLTVANHTPSALTNLVVTVPLPDENAFLEHVLDGGETMDGLITWHVDRLEPEGGSSTLNYLLRAENVTTDGYPQILTSGYQTFAQEWPESAYGPELRTFIGDRLPVWAVQGDGLRSPYLHKHVSTAGIVTGAFPDLEGFWIEEAIPDGDPLTSEGLFVSTGDLDLTPNQGDLVQVHGQVREPYQQTTLVIDSPEDMVTISQDNPLPGGVELDPPRSNQDAMAYYETMEGMMVRVTEPTVAVAPTSKYGEYVLVPEKHQVSRLWRGEENGFAIVVDDGSSQVHLDRTTLSYTVVSGDRVSGLYGPLAFTFGQYKVEPLAQPDIQHRQVAMDGLPAIKQDQFSLMSWNVENLFDTRAPHPSDPPLPRLGQYSLALNKVANTILAAGYPTVVALQEVENIGILQDLAAMPQLSVHNYQPVLVEGGDSRGIDVGYLIRGDRARIEDIQQHNAPEGLTSRPPLMVELELETPSRSLTVYVINNHFTSMSGGEAATEPRRNAQAMWNLSLVDTILAADPDAHIAVLGDLNSFLESQPLDTLRRGGLQHVFENNPGRRYYTYIYQGQSQVLDHILVTPSLMELLERVEVLHLNADYPPPQPDDPSPIGKSDHDPLVAVFSTLTK